MLNYKTNTMNDYTPISGSLYYKLETDAIHKTMLHICYEGDDHEHHEVSGTISDFDIRTEDYIILDNGMKIRMDMIRELNGKVFKDEC